MNPSESPVPHPNPLVGDKDPLVDALLRVAASIRAKQTEYGMRYFDIEAEAMESIAKDVSAARFGTAANPTVLLQVAFPTRDIQWPLPRSVAMEVVRRVEGCIRSRGTGVPPDEEERLYRSRDTRSEEGGGTLCGSVFDLGDAVGASAMLPPGSPHYAG